MWEFESNTIRYIKITFDFLNLKDLNSLYLFESLFSLYYYYL